MSLIGVGKWAISAPPQKYAGYHQEWLLRRCAERLAEAITNASSLEHEGGSLACSKSEPFCWNVLGVSDARRSHSRQFAAKPPVFELSPIWCCCSRGSQASPLSLRPPSLSPALLSTVSAPLLFLRWLALPLSAPLLRSGVEPRFQCN